MSTSITTPNLLLFLYKLWQGTEKLSSSCKPHLCLISALKFPHNTPHESSVHCSSVVTHTKWAASPCLKLSMALPTRHRFLMFTMWPKTSPTSRGCPHPDCTLQLPKDIKSSFTYHPCTYLPEMALVWKYGKFLYFGTSSSIISWSSMSTSCLGQMPSHLVSPKKHFSFQFYFCFSSKSWTLQQKAECISEISEIAL